MQRTRPTEAYSGTIVAAASVISTVIVVTIMAMQAAVCGILSLL